MNDSTKPHCGNYQAEKQQVANRKGKQLVLVSNLVLIAMQFGPYMFHCAANKNTLTPSPPPVRQAGPAVGKRKG